jgi:hypothetical protein
VVAGQRDGRAGGGHDHHAGGRARVGVVRI